jgi:glycosyltransferase involved in cell wall biosynthesis
MNVGFGIWQAGNGADGGVESITHVIERLRHVRPVVVTQRETARTERWRRSGAEVHVLRDVYEAWTQDPAGVRHVPRNNAWMARLVRARGLQVVHCNDLPSFLNIGLGARLAGARLVFNVRDVKAPGQPYKLTWRLAATMASQVVALSADMAHDLETRLSGLFAPPRVTYFYSVVDVERMRVPTADERSALRARLGLPPDRFVIAYVAAVNEKKQQLAFLERAMPALAARVPSAQVAFVGDFHPARDDYARRCEAAAAPFVAADRVRWVGYTPDVADWYRAADLVVLASRNEGLARSMIEGIACGTPVVSFDVCSAREILEEHGCGRVVAQGDYDGLVGAIAGLAEDPAERRRLGAAGARAARTLFDPARAVERYEGLYTQLARGGDLHA